MKKKTTRKTLAKSARRFKRQSAAVELRDAKALAEYHRKRAEKFSAALHTVRKERNQLLKQLQRAVDTNDRACAVLVQSVSLTKRAIEVAEDLRAKALL